MAAPISLLDVIDARDQRNPRECLTHVCYIAKGVEDVAAVMAGHKRLVEETTGTTGIFMCQEGVLLHYIEAPPADAITLLRQLNGPGSGANADDVRILHNSEDCPSRYFSKWSAVGPLSISDEGEVPVPSADDAVDLAFELLQGLMAVGKGEAQPEHKCPSQKRIMAYSKCKAFFSLAEYMEFFDTTLTVNLESEDVWPYQPVIRYEGL